MRMVFRVAFALFFCVLLPSMAFLAGYALTDTYFRVKKITYPFASTGVAVGGGLFFWVLAIGIFINSIVFKKEE